MFHHTLYSGNWQTAQSISVSQLASRTMYNRVLIPHQGQRPPLHPCRGCCGDLSVFPKQVDEWLVIRAYLEPASVEIVMKTFHSSIDDRQCLFGRSSSQREIEYVTYTRLVSQHRRPLCVRVPLPGRMAKRRR